MNFREGFAPLRTADGRIAGWCWGRKPICTNRRPELHRLEVPRQKKPILTESIFSCEWHADYGKPACGSQLYVRRIPRFDKHQPQEWFVCEVTQDHINKLSRGDPKSFLETMTILGCVLPGVEFDLPRCRQCHKRVTQHFKADHEFDPEEL